MKDLSFINNRQTGFEKYEEDLLLGMSKVMPINGTDWH
jgi:hypothetical protein